MVHHLGYNPQASGLVSWIFSPFEARVPHVIPEAVDEKN